MRRAALLVLLAVGTAWAQSPSHVPRVTAAPIDKVTVTQGRSAPVTFMFRVAPGYHINSNKPNSELLIPTALNLSVPTNVSVAKLEYPDGKDLAFPFSPDEKLNVYTGDFSVNAKVVTTSVTPRGTYRVHGMLRYQACDNRACYPPTTIPLSFDVTVAKAVKAASSKRTSRQSPHIR